MAKKKKTKKNKNSINDQINSIKSFSDDIYGKLILVCVVICIFCIFYLVTLYVTRDENASNDKEDKTTNISYEKIIGGKSFSMNDSDYYVLFYDESNDEESATYSELFNNYKMKEDPLNIYYVDLGSAINNTIKTSEESNKNPNSASELKVNGPTLIHFSNHSVVDYIEGEELIRSNLE